MKRGVCAGFVAGALLLASSCNLPIDLMSGNTYPQRLKYFQEHEATKTREDWEDCIRQASEAGLGMAKAKKDHGFSILQPSTEATNSDDFLRALMREHDLDPAQKKYVEECLRRKGYFPTIRWW